MPAPAFATALVLASLREAGPATRVELEHRLAIGKASVSRAVAALHGVEVRVSAWRTGRKPNAAAKREQRRYTPVFAVGGEPDAKKPAAMTPAQSKRRYKQRVRNSAAATDRVRALERARYWANRAPRRDPMIEALFGSHEDAGSTKDLP